MRQTLGRPPKFDHSLIETLFEEGHSTAVIVQRTGASRSRVKELRQEWRAGRSEPQVRRCGFHGCTTPLCSYNDGPHCFLHEKAAEEEFLSAIDYEFLLTSNETALRESPDDNPLPYEDEGDPESLYRSDRSRALWWIGKPTTESRRNRWRM